MAKKKQISEVELIYTNTDIQITNISEQILEPIVEEIVYIPTIHDKYQKFINQALEGYLVGFEYPYAMEVLRYCENKRKIQLGLNMSCATCLIDLLKMFNNLRD